MNNENKKVFCNCKEVEGKLISLLNDNGNLLQMIRRLRKENERLEGELRRSGPASSGSRPDRTGTDVNNAEVQSLIEINHGWKRDYEELQTRYEILSGEKKLLEEEEKELKERIDELERRQAPLEGEIARLAAALYTQHGCQGERRSYDYDEQCEILKTQITVYKEDFERERRDREKVHEEKEKLKDELREAEEIIKKLTNELDSCRGMSDNRRTVGQFNVQPEDGYVTLREQMDVHPRHQVQLVVPYSPIIPSSEHRWRLEQHRRGILPRKPPPTSFFYGGEVEVDRPRA